jgi:hypothetical protein
MPRYAYGQFSISLPTGWFDITDENDGGPTTLARPDGVGALQFTIATYRRGPKPSASAADLANMISDFAEAACLGRGFDHVRETATLLLAAASFEQAEWFMRVWFVSDAINFGQITYTAQATAPRSELFACETIVRSIRWANGI